MTPLNTPHTNHVLGAPQGWNVIAHGPCVGLPVCITEDPCIYSWWSLTWRERIAALFGQPLRLCIASAAHPPVSLEFTDK